MFQFFRSPRAAGAGSRFRFTPELLPLEARDQPDAPGPGGNAAPVLTNFTAYQVMGNLFAFSGHVSDEAPAMAYIVLHGVPSVEGMVIYADASGHFEAMFELLGDGSDD